MTTFRAHPHPADPWLEFDAMRYDWSESNVRVLCVPSSANPLLRGGLTDRDLVIGLDEASVRVAADSAAGARQSRCRVPLEACLRRYPAAARSVPPCACS